MQRSLDGVGILRQPDGPVCGWRTVHVRGIRHDDFLYSYSSSASNAVKVARTLSIIALRRHGVPDH